MAEIPRNSKDYKQIDYKKMQAESIKKTFSFLEIV